MHLVCLTCVLGAVIARVVNASQVRYDSSCWHQCEQQLEGRTTEAVISKSTTIILDDFFFSFVWSATLKGSLQSEALQRPHPWRCLANPHEFRVLLLPLGLQWALAAANKSMRRKPDLLQMCSLQAVGFLRTNRTREAFCSKCCIRIVSMMQEKMSVHEMLRNFWTVNDRDFFNFEAEGCTLQTLLLPQSAIPTFVLLLCFSKVRHIFSNLFWITDKISAKINAFCSVWNP